MSSNFWTKLQDQENTIATSIKNSLMQLLAMDPNLGCVSVYEFGLKKKRLNEYLTNLAKGILFNVMQNNRTTFPFLPTVKVRVWLWEQVVNQSEWKLANFDVILDYA